MAGEHSKACCELPPFASNYQPKGQVSTVGDLPTYFVGEKGKRAIILVYDIFGFHPNTHQFADELAAKGFFVAEPDFFRGNPWPLEKLPFELPELMAHLEQHVPESRMVADIGSVCRYLRSNGVESIGTVGFCWGAIYAVKANVEGLIDATATAHPSRMSVESVKDVKGPVALLPSKDEPDLIPLMEAMKEKPFGDKNVHVRFDDMHHGWCAARSDYSSPANAQRAREALQIMARFFDETLQAKL
ncbi:hypothetical protein SpCBS45565_g01996 [Spizellomyces sp. 'palustris']|nr:hypothetical protein SpCBS45565_g01996 [Spizellomyces sp. 'palustris']